MKKLIVFLMFFLLNLTAISGVSAEIGIIPAPDGIQGVWGRLQDGGPVKFVAAFIAFMVAVAVAFFFIKIILAGIKIITNSKDPAQFYEGMKAIMWGTIGILIIASAYMIVSWVGMQLFGSPESLLEPIKQLPE